MHKESLDYGYVLKTHDLSDTSLIVYIFLKNAGIIKTIARGAKSAKSPFTGTLELLNQVEISYQKPRGNTDLHPLQEARVLARYEGIRTSYERLLMASYYSALVEYWLEAQQQDTSPVFALFERAVEYANSGDPSWKGVTYFESELSNLLGYSSRSEEVRKIHQASERIKKLRDQVAKAWKV